jgi:two-component system, NarL family, sensor histidine kinase EvgS
MRLKQVLTNLLSNACKYTAAGRVWLHVTRDTDGALRFVVGDTGVGIAQGARASLFNPFATADGDARPAVPEGSTGLGLAICRQLVTLMGGRIALRSEPGRGTEVTVHVPVPGTPAPTVATARIGDVLVCDDDPVSRLMMTEMLRRSGFGVEDTADGEQALARWRRGGLSAIVTDLDMPGISGHELIRTIRAAEAEAGKAVTTAIVVCSGSDVPTDAGDSAPAGQQHDAYLLKPVEMDTLAQTLRDLGVASA